jgi:hypothetical protein
MWGKQEVTKSRETCPFGSSGAAYVFEAVAVTSARAYGIHLLVLCSRKLLTPMGYLNPNQKYGSSRSVCGEASFCNGACGHEECEIALDQYTAQLLVRFPNTSGKSRNFITIFL